MTATIDATEVRNARTAHSAPCLPTLRLALFDGVERDYLLDTPTAPPAASHGAVYDRRVHAAYHLARQGYDALWLARFAELPPAAARRITAMAARTRGDDG